MDNEIEPHCDAIRRHFLGLRDLGVTREYAAMVAATILMEFDNHALHTQGRA